MDAAAKKQLSDRKKAYNSVRKDKLKGLSAKLKKQYTAIKAHVSALPKKQRAKEAKKLRAIAKQKHDDAKKSIPTASKKSIGELSVLIKKVQRLKV